MINNPQYILRQLNQGLMYLVSYALLIGLAVMFLSSCTEDPVTNALKATDPSEGIENVGKITELAKLEMVSSGALDNQVREAAKIRYYAIQCLNTALNNVREEHRQRFFNAILPALNILCDPEVVNEIVEIESIHIEWKEIYAQYYGIAKKPGEEFLCNIFLNCQNYPIRCYGKTSFPELTGNGNFLPADINSEYLKRQVYRLLSQAKLIKIVNGYNSFDDKFAICFLTDQSMLTEIALYDEDHVSREYAASALTDQSTLSKIALEDEDKSVREVAVGKLINQVLLSKIALEDEDRYVREVAIGKLIDHALLSKIALEDEDPYIKHVSANKLALLIKIEQKDFTFSDSDLKIITDQNLLYKIFLNVEKHEQEKILWKITDQTILGKIAEEKDYSEYLWIVCFLLTDQSILKKIVEKKATYTLKSEDILIFDSKKTLWDDDRYVRIAAVENLTDQTVLAGLLGNKDFEVRCAVVKRLNDMSILTKVALEDKDWQVRAVAIRKLTDVNVLKSIQENEVDESLKDLAYKRLARLLLPVNSNM